MLCCVKGAEIIAVIRSRNLLGSFMHLACSREEWNSLALAQTTFARKFTTAYSYRSSSKRPNEWSHNKHDSRYWLCVDLDYVFAFFSAIFVAAILLKHFYADYSVEDCGQFCRRNLLFSISRIHLSNFLLVRSPQSLSLLASVVSLCYDRTCSVRP